MIMDNGDGDRHKNTKMNNHWTELYLRCNNNNTRATLSYLSSVMQICSSIIIQYFFLRSNSFLLIELNS
jgi:hypothetical protein